jgi:hypothetical protein
MITKHRSMEVDVPFSESHDFVGAYKLLHGASVDDVGDLLEDLVVGHD